MHLTRKQTILIVTLSAVAVLLLVGLLLFLQYFRKSDPVPQEPSLPPATAAPTPEITPSPTPAPTETPSPTPYYLPLVPEGAARAPTILSTPTVSPSPAPVAEAMHPRDGVYNEQVKEFMAIGTQNGEAIAVLLVHAAPPEAIVAAIPVETAATVYTLGKDASITSVDTAPLKTATARAESTREGCWNLVWAVKNLLGYRAPAYLCMDFDCMEAFFSFAPELLADGIEIDLAAFLRMLNEPDETRALDMARLGVAIVRYLDQVSLWELPAFRKATRGAFTSSLSVFELLGLMGDLREIRTFTVTVLPTETKDGVRTLSDAAKLPF